MTNETVSYDAQQSNQWKQVFETAVDELGSGSEATQVARRMPIVNRIRIARAAADPVTAQKRAIADAAAALAALWKRPSTRARNGAARTGDNKAAARRLGSGLERAHSF